jgi:transposase
MVKLLDLQYLYNLSDVQVIEDASLNLAYMYFLDMFSGKISDRYRPKKWTFSVVSNRPYVSPVINPEQINEEI